MEKRATTISTHSNVSARARLLGGVKFRRKSKPSKGAKLEFIEGMRAVAALYVVIGHICSMIDTQFLSVGKAGVAPWLHALMSPFWHGHLAVAAFIVLSGFSLQYGLFHRGNGRVYGLGKFFLRRGLRILPAYYACLAFSLWVCNKVTIPNGDVLPFSNYVPIDDAVIWSHILLVHNWSQAWMYKINGVLWSIGIEAQLYLIFPWLILLMQKRSPRVLFVTVAIPALLIAATVPGAAKLYSWFAILFAAGMISAHYCFRPDLQKGLKPGIAAKTVVVGVALTGIIVNYSLSQGRPFDAMTLVLSDLTFGIATAAFLYYATAKPGTWLEKTFANRNLVRVGIFSYSLYLLHHPLLQVLYLNRPAFAQQLEVAFFYLLLVGVPVILACTWLFSLVFEKPFVKSTVPSFATDSPTQDRIQLPLIPFTEATLISSKANFAYLAGEKNADSEKSKSASKPKKKGRLY